MSSEMKGKTSTYQSIAYSNKKYPVWKECVPLDCRNPHTKSSILKKLQLKDQRNKSIETSEEANKNL